MPVDLFQHLWVGSLGLDIAGRNLQEYVFTTGIPRASTARRAFANNLTTANDVSYVQYSSTFDTGKLH